MDLIVNRRGEQLKEQAKIDEDLRFLTKQCPTQVADYLLVRRNINRKQYETIRAGGIMGAYSTIHRNIEEIDADQKHVKELFSTGDRDDIQICETLRKYNEQLSSR